MPPTVAVLATLLLILLMPRRVPLWGTLAVACLALPLLSGEGVAGAWAAWSAAATHRETWIFVALCAGVFVLSSILTHGGHLAALCDVAAAVIPSRRIRAAVMPAVVGLVPMPGGAVVSAPLIDRALGASGVSGTDKNLVNYWFRHIWEVSWPLYPAVLVAARALGPGDHRFYLAQGALTVVLAVAGSVALLRALPAGEGDARRPMPPRLLRALLPLAALVVLPFVGVLDAGGGRGPFRDVVIAVLVATVLGLVTAIDRAGLARVPRDRRIYSMTVLALLVKVFGDLVGNVLGASGLLAAGIPSWLVVLGAPFLVGFATGATLTFATATFPLIHLMPGDVVPWLVLAYAGGFVGYLTSPVHMCFVLSTRYFDSRLLSAYGRLALPLLAFLAAACGLFLLLGGRFRP